MRARSLTVGLVAALACGQPAAVEEAALGEVCGEAGPVRLLALAPGHRLRLFPLQVGERHYFRTSRTQTGPNGEQLEMDAAVWSVDRCGGAPRQIASGRHWISTVGDRWPGVVIGCSEANDELVVFDPLGGPASPLMPGAGCSGRWTEHGVVTIEAEGEDEEAEFGALVLYPFPEDPRGEAPPPRLLHPEVRLRSSVGEMKLGTWALLQVLPASVFVIDAEHALLHIDLASGETTRESAGVLSLQVSADGRYLLWQQVVGDSAAPESPVILKDRGSGTSVALGETVLASTGGAFEHAEQQWLTLRMTADYTLRAFHLPDLASLEVPEAAGVTAILGARRWLLDSFFFGATVLDPTTGVVTALFGRSGSVRHWTDEQALILRRERPEDLEGVLYGVPFDGSKSRVVAARASWYSEFLADRRIVTVVETDEQLRGRLLLVDLDSASEQQIDDDVAITSLVLDAGFGPGHVVYSVDAGERSGVYVARLPER